MKIIINGANGRMGKTVVSLALASGEFACAVDSNVECEAQYPVFPTLNAYDGDADIIIDFSHYLATEDLLAYAVKRNLPVVIATTGHTAKELAMIDEAAKTVPIFHSANMSLGVALLVELAKQTVAKMPDAEIEIIETHHDQKLDAPSGTALLIADGIREVRPECYAVTGRSGYGKRTKDEIGISSVRIGNVVGEHEVIVSTPTQTLTLKHTAHSRSLFADGAMSAAKFLVGKKPGLYTMKDVVNE